MPFSPNKRFKRKYDKLFRKNPAAANMLLLLCELSNGYGEVETNEEELALLMAARFENPSAYQLPGGPKR